MNNKLMQKNVFFQTNKKKSNPDILTKKREKDNERKTNIFKSSSVTYNSITNQIPNTIKTQRDLELIKDTPIDNIAHLIEEKAKERIIEEQKFKPVKQKMISTDENILDIQHFNELKSEHQQITKEQNNIILNNKSKFNGLLNNLKNLGIIEK